MPSIRMKIRDYRRLPIL